MGRILVNITIANALNPEKEIRCEALVDTGAWGMLLPRAWKDKLGSLPVVRTVELVTADQRIVTGGVSGPVTIRIEGFDPVSSEVTFVNMELEGGRYRPLLGYTILEQAGVAVDMVGYQLVKVPHMDARSTVRPVEARLRDGGDDRGIAGYGHYPPAVPRRSARRRTPYLTGATSSAGTGLPGTDLKLDVELRHARLLDDQTFAGTRHQALVRIPALKKG